MATEVEHFLNYRNVLIGCRLLLLIPAVSSSRLIPTGSHSNMDGPPCDQISDGLRVKEELLALVIVSINFRCTIVSLEKILWAMGMVSTVGRSDGRPCFKVAPCSVFSVIYRYKWYRWREYSENSRKFAADKLKAVKESRGKRDPLPQFQYLQINCIRTYTGFTKSACGISSARSIKRSSSLIVPCTHYVSLHKLISER